MESDESFSEMLENEAPVGFGGGRNAGKRSTGAVLKAKMEIRKNILSLRPGILSYQKKIEKISSIFSVLFPDMRFPRTSHRQGESILFLGEELGSVGRKNATPHEDRFLPCF